FFSCHAPNLDLPSFPTRRSSDLCDMTGTPISFAHVALPLAERGWRPFPGLQASKIPAMRGWPGLNEFEWDNDDLVATIGDYQPRSEEHTSELQSLTNLVCRLLLE